MTFVSEEYVENVYKDFYDKDSVGKWLDENSIDWLKSDGAVFEFESGVSYYAGLIIASVYSCGLAALAAGLAGCGQGAEMAWSSMRDSSFEGIKALYEKGEITEDVMDIIIAIRSITDEEWTQITEDYEKGIISQEDFKKIKGIREMPEEWTTIENYSKGLAVGIANGGWEALQWYLGGKIANAAFKGSKFLVSTKRVAIDGGMNALDTPFRTALNSATTGETLEESWDKMGGFKAMSFNFALGAAGSAVGEALSNVRVKKVSENVENTEIYGPFKPDKYEFKFENVLPEGRAFIEEITDTMLISKQLGDTLEEILKNDNYVIGVHMAGLAEPADILNNGLHLTGHGIGGTPELRHNINFHNTGRN